MFNQPYGQMPGYGFPPQCVPAAHNAAAVYCVICDQQGTGGSGADSL